MRLYRKAILSFAMFTAFGLLSSVSSYLNDLAQGRQHTLTHQLFDEMTAIYIVWAIFPLMSRVMRSHRLQRASRWAALVMSCIAMAIFSVLDTSALAILRKLLSPAVGLGTYDYGNLLYRYPMELARHAPIYVVLMVSVYFFDRYRESKNRQLKHAELEAHLAEAQLKALRLQLEPHFLFNTLNTISSVMHENVARADEMLVQLSDLLRHTLKHTSAQHVTLAEELALLEKYVAIMKGRMGEALQINYFCDPTSRAAFVPPLILQPLVENAIRHGRTSSSSRLVVNIESSVKDGCMYLSVQDNGPGLAEGSLQSRHGIGLSNTEGRLQRLYGQQHTLVLEGNKGLKVSITMPLQMECPRES